MPRKTSTQQPQPTCDEVLGDFAVSNWSDRLYAKVYYAIRERQGFLARRNLGEAFDWDAFKDKFAEAFGTPEHRKYTHEELLAYAMQKFGMTEDDLIEANNRSWERRREWESEREAEAEAEAALMEGIPEEIPY